MTRHHQLERLAPLIEDLVLEDGQVARGRRILAALVDGDLARGAALWTEDPARGWVPLASRGEAACMPTQGQVEAVASGQLDGHLPPDRRVFVMGAPGQRSALCTLGLPEDEELQDMLEAILVLHDSLDGPEPGSPGGIVDMLMAPFGMSSSEQDVPHLPSAETASLFALLEEACEEDDEADPDCGSQDR